MRDGTRAAWSAAMLVGFLAVAWLQVGAALLIVYVFLQLLPGSVALRVAVPLTIATGGLLLYATLRALRPRYRSPAGVPISRADAPALWSLVDAASSTAGVAPPAGVTVVAGAAATLTERVRLGGLAGGRRDLLIGMPLLLAWDEAHLRAVVAHELAHGSPRLGHFAPMAYRGRVAIGRLVRRIPRRSPAGPVLRAYAALHRRIDAPFSRAQELAADRVGAEFAGTGAAVAVLRDGPALDGMQHLFHTEYLSPGWQAGYAPVDIFGGLLQVLAARADEAARLRAQDPEPPSEWDTHPPLADREVALATASAPAAAAAPAPGAVAAPARRSASAAEAALASASVRAAEATAPAAAASARVEAPSSPSPEAVTAPASAPAAEATAPVAPGSAGSHVAADVALSRPAGDLVPDLPGLARALQAVAFPPGGREVVSWDDFFSAARKAEMEREADASLRAVSRAADAPVANVADVLDLAADGRLRKITETVFDDLPTDQTAERITDLITLLLALAALHSGVARWRHSWSGAAELVAIDGSHLDLAGPAALATDPATVADARKWLASLGIDLTASRGDGRPARVAVLGGVVNVAVDGTRKDVLVIETGLVLLPSLPRTRNAEAKRRLTRWAADGVLADGSAPAAEAPAGEDGWTFVPFTDVARASAVRNGRRSWEIVLRDGRTVSLRTGLDSDELPGGWSALDDAVAFLSGTR